MCVRFSVFVCALRRADHPSKKSYRLSLIKKLRKLSPILQSGSKIPRVGAKRKKKTAHVTSHPSTADSINSDLRRLTSILILVFSVVLHCTPLYCYSWFFCTRTVPSLGIRTAQVVLWALPSCGSIRHNVHNTQYIWLWQIFVPILMYNFKGIK
jgi:hypothetical protein